MSHYVLGSNGLQKPQKYNLEVGKAYYFGASSDPDVVIITRLDDKWAYYLKISDSRFELSYAEQKIERVIAEDLVSNGMDTRKKREDQYKQSPFYAPSYNDKILESNDPSDYDYPQDYMTFEENMTFQQEKQRNYKPPKYIDAVEVAKLVREDLKSNFPGVKFSVKTNKYSGGSSIDVKWVDGPTSKQVESVIGMYHGSTFDGMQDLKESHNSELNGEIVHYGNDYIFCNRNYTRKALEEVAAHLYTIYGWNVAIIDSSYGESYFDTGKLPYRESSDINTELYNYSFCKIEETPAPETTEDQPINPPALSADVRVSEYKGHPVISLPIGDNEFTFGLNKAKAILSYLEDIKKFVEDNS